VFCVFESESQWKNDKIQLSVNSTILVRALRHITHTTGFTRVYDYRKTDIRMIQIDGPRRRAYIKYYSIDRPYAVLLVTEGCVEFRHDNCELSLVNISLAAMGIRRSGMAGLVPKVKEETIREALSPYGEVREVYEETWSNGYRYQNIMEYALL